MKITIERSRWISGQPIHNLGPNAVGAGETALLNDHGFMCCLGFVCIQLGLTEDQIEGQPEPSYLGPETHSKIGDVFFDTHGLANEFTAAAIEINDDPQTPRQQREKELTSLFKDYGYDLEFTGKYKTF
jgi:hypothetical protein